jgi:hypothetical protein
LLETALRMREQDLLMMREEMSRLEFHNQALQRELAAVRLHAPPGAMKVSPEYAAQTYQLRRITLGRGTGGLDDDRQPGDEGLLVVIEPRDINDDVIKAPGSAEVVAMEVSPTGLKSPIGTWVIPQDQVRRGWRSGLISTGYFLTLAWQTPPQTENVRLVVRFTTPDGRTFEADRDIRVRAGPHMPRANGPMQPPPNTEPLPLPRPVDPNGVPAPNPIAPSGERPLPLPDGPALDSTSHWRASGLEDAFRLRRPESISAPAAAPPEGY